MTPREMFEAKIAAARPMSGAPAMQPAPPVAPPPMAAPAMPVAHTLAHGRAIAGAKALHAVGHISEAQRDKHVSASMKAIGKAPAKGAPPARKPFGSFAPVADTDRDAR